MLNAQSVVLIVDDEETNRNILHDRMVSLGHIPLEADNGKVAISMIKQQQPDLILLDLMMPVMDGYETLHYLKSNETYKHIPVIIISAKHDQDSIVKGIELGADDYLNKPFKPAILKARISASLEKKYLHDREKMYVEKIKTMNTNLQKYVDKQTEEIVKGQEAMTFAICKMVESRDHETGQHLERMREYAKTLALQLQKLPKYTGTIDDTFIDILYKASPLHDIGKIGVPDYILKKPDKLTPEEFKIMKTHAEIGEESLYKIYKENPSNPVLYMGSQIAGKHQEKWDGTGYPNALKGESIPLAARIIALADVYDALTTIRPYKEAFTHARAKEIILKENRKHFDPDIVQAFLETEETFISIHKTFGED